MRFLPQQPPGGKIGHRQGTRLVLLRALTYFFGIIDILQEYPWPIRRKRVAAEVDQEVAGGPIIALIPKL